MEEKQQQLFSILREHGRRSSSPIPAAPIRRIWPGPPTQALGDKSLAITADSASIPESHKRDAIDFARQFGIRHELIPTHEFENPDYLKNDANRCFHCKDELFDRLEESGASAAIAHIVYGVNMDDLGDYRPGQNAAKLHQVKAPLVEAKLSKAEIRELSRQAGLPTWDRPAAACLSSRIPYGTPVTIENIKKVENGEEELKALGFRQFRVRFHGEIVAHRNRAGRNGEGADPRHGAKFTAIFKKLGFQYVTLDLEGYRQGSLNEVLTTLR